jgi:hypothetical protein
LREHLQVGKTARRPSRFHARRGITGARTGGGTTVRGWDTALGCAPVLPPPPLITQLTGATARRPAHRMVRRAARGAGRRRRHVLAHARRRGEPSPGAGVRTTRDTYTLVQAKPNSRRDGQRPEHQPQRAACHRGPTRWATPRRGHGQGVLGCGWLGLTHACA